MNAPTASQRNVEGADTSAATRGSRRWRQDEEDTRAKHRSPLASQASPFGAGGVLLERSCCTARVAVGTRRHKAARGQIGGRRACGWLVGAINYGAIGRVEQGARVWLGLSPRILFAIWRGLCSRASRTTLTPSPPRACRVRRRRVTAFNACREARPRPSLRVRGPGLPRRHGRRPCEKYHRSAAAAPLR